MGGGCEGREEEERGDGRGVGERGRGRLREGVCWCRGEFIIRPSSGGIKKLTVTRKVRPRSLPPSLPASLLPNHATVVGRCHLRSPGGVCAGGMLCGGANGRG